MQVNIYDSREAMGRAAAEAVAAKITELLATRKFVNIVFAAAPSQEEFLAALREIPVEWSRVNAFHMDERRCLYCQQIFRLSKFQPLQAVCGGAECQRRRRTAAILR